MTLLSTAKVLGATMMLTGLKAVNAFPTYPGQDLHCYNSSSPAHEVIPCPAEEISVTAIAVVCTLIGTAAGAASYGLYRCFRNQNQQLGNSVSTEMTQPLTAAALEAGDSAAVRNSYGSNNTP